MIFFSSFKFNDIFHDGQTDENKLLLKGYYLLVESGYGCGKSFIGNCNCRK